MLDQAIHTKIHKVLFIAECLVLEEMNKGAKTFSN